MDSSTCHANTTKGRFPGYECWQDQLEELPRTLQQTFAAQDHQLLGLVQGLRRGSHRVLCISSPIHQLSLAMIRWHLIPGLKHPDLCSIILYLLQVGKHDAHGSIKVLNSTLPGTGVSLCLWIRAFRARIDLVLPLVISTKPLEMQSQLEWSVKERLEILYQAKEGWGFSLSPQQDSQPNGTFCLHSAIFGHRQKYGKKSLHHGMLGGLLTGPLEAESKLCL